MLPELLRIPSLNITLSTYGALLTIAFMSGIQTSALLAERDGLPKGKLYELGAYMVPSSIVGTKLLTVIISWNKFENHWEQTLTFAASTSVGAYLGGFLVALGVSSILTMVWHLPWRKVADASAPGLALGNVIGRIGCFAAGCCWGKPTTSCIGVRFPEKAHQMSGVPIDTMILPTQLIQAGANLLSFIFLMWLWRRRTFNGQIILAYIILYSVERFTIDFWRDDPRGEFFGLATSQIISSILLPLALALMIYCWQQKSAYRRKSLTCIR
ncbi:MAG: prolipoprotein diacylglyceryl transferase [Blastocatellia bacterium]